MIIYGAAGGRISQALKSDMKTAEEYIKRYFIKFKGLKKWLYNTSQLGKHQKWLQNPLGRKVFVYEANSKGSDNAVERKGPNAIIQGFSSDMTKLAIHYIQEEFDIINSRKGSFSSSYEDAQIEGVVHDEVIVDVPGEYRILDMVKNDKGIWKPIVEYGEGVKEYVSIVENNMVKAQQEYLTPLIQDIYPGQSFPSKADAKPVLTWGDK